MVGNRHLPIGLFLSKKAMGVAGEWYLKDRTLGVLTVEGQSGQGRVVCSLDKSAGGWRYVAAVVDSGAEETVAPPGLLPGRVVESPMQRSGGRSRARAANGSRIPNLGQQDVSVKTPEGHGCSLRFQVADVERPLISVSQMSKTGRKVEFESAQGLIIHKQSGKRIRLQRVGGVYLLRMKVRDDREVVPRARPGGAPSERVQPVPRTAPVLSRHGQ